MTLQTKFEINQQVHIIPLDRTGVVKSFSFDKFGVGYYVRYFDNTPAPQHCYFMENEIEPVKEKQTAGYSIIVIPPDSQAA